MSKIRRLYDSHKENDNYTLIIIKNGIFYYSYSEDAVILWFLFDYKIKDDTELGFGTNSYDKVLKELRKSNISFKVFSSSDVILDSYDADYNLYKSYHALSDKKYKESKELESLFSKVKLLVESDRDNYNLINKYLDKLLN